MVKRRNINVKNPLVMKSDESTSGRDSAITEQTEKCSNKKDAKRRSRGYERFGTKRLEGKILEGKILEGRTNSNAAGTSPQGVAPLPPLPPVRASKASENDSRVANTKEKSPRKTSDPIEPSEYEEDALLLKKRVPSGQSCSAFFLGDGSTASGISGKEKRGKVKVGGVSPTKSSKAKHNVTPKSIKVKLPAAKPAASPVIKDPTTSPNEETKNDPKEPKKQSETEQEPASPKSNLSALKSQLLALSKKVEKSEEVQEEEIHEEPSKSIETEVDVKEVERDENEEKVGESEKVKASEIEEVKVDVEASTTNASEADVERSNEKGADAAQQDADMTEAKQAGKSKPGEKEKESNQEGESDVAVREESVKPTANPKETEGNGADKTSTSSPKKRQMTMTSFLGKQSKVIDENAEYVPDNEDRYAGILEQASDEIMDIHLQATLSDCEFSSVQSSVTTDHLLEAQPSLIKRTGSLIRNPLLRRNRSKKNNDMDELIQRMKNGKLAAKADNNKEEEFDEMPNRNKRLQKGRRSSSGISSSRRSEVYEFDDSEDDIEEMYDLDPADSNADPLNGKKFQSDESSSSSYGEDLITKGTFDDSLAKRRGGLPKIDTSAKMDVRSPTFRLSAVSGAGTGLSSPLAQQIMLNALNEQSNPSLQNMQNAPMGILRNVHSADNGTQTSAECQGPGIGFNSNTGSAPASCIGTFGDLVETLGLFSARLCLGTGAAIVSCSRACNDNPRRDVKQVSLSSSSFIEPDVGMFTSPRNAGATSPVVLSQNAMSPRNEIFRNGPMSPLSGSNGYTLALADAISKMPEQDQLDLVRQLSSKSYGMSPKSADMDDMASSVDGMFRQRGSRMKRVPHNIAMKPKHVRMEDVFPEQQHMGQINLPSEANPAPAKKPMGRFRRGLKRLAKTKLTVMYQV